MTPRSYLRFSINKIWKINHKAAFSMNCKYFLFSSQTKFIFSLCYVIHHNIIVTPIRKTKILIYLFVTAEFSDLKIFQFYLRWYVTSYSSDITFRFVSNYLEMIIFVLVVKMEGYRPR